MDSHAHLIQVIWYRTQHVVNPTPPERSHLHLHGLFNSRWDVNVLYLVAQAANPPVIRRLVDGVHDVGVQRLSLLIKEFQD